MTVVRRIAGWLTLTLLVALPSVAQTSRTDLEAKLPELREAYRTAPGDPDARRDYAQSLFELGDVWEANDVVAPLAARPSASAEELSLAARVAAYTLDLARAESLYQRLLAASEPGTEQHEDATRGLALVHYQSQDFAKTRSLDAEALEEGRAALLRFLQAFEGEPYRMEWSGEPVARLPFTNDTTQPGALPEVEVVVNGETVLLTLDTGGDRLYLDVSVAEKTGIRELVVSRQKYAYTGGKLVDEPLGVADEVELGGVTLRNVPAVVAQWKANGPTTDGVLGTAILKQFLTTIDYEGRQIVLRPRGDEGMKAFRESLGGRELVRMPFVMASTHLMFAKGQINGHEGLNLFMDSGLAASMPVVLVNETTDLFGLEKNDIEGTPYYWSPLEDHGLAGFPGGAAQGLGNVFVEGDNYKSQGFFWDALISHQYLWKLGFWTIDFDTMSYYFPAESELPRDAPAEPAETKETVELDAATAAAYVGSYEIGGGAVVLEISAKDGRLFLQAPGQQPVPMEAYADGTFGIPLAGAEIVFEGDTSSGIEALELHQAGNVTRAVKQSP